MAENANENQNRIEAFPEPLPTTVVSDELKRIAALLRGEFPFAAHVSFEFERSLHVHIDVRRREEISVVESRLAALGGGTLFAQTSCGNTPLHPFMHRISALVAR